MKDKPIVLIMCGGRSKRLWPISEYKSKNFLNIFGFSPLQETIKRFKKITSPGRIFCVTGVKDKSDVSRVKELKKGNVFVEPASKNTAAAILLALYGLKGKEKSTLIISPVDHLIKEENAFYKAIRQASLGIEGGGICALGIKPRSFNSDFGYIQAGKKEKYTYQIRKFIEKPNISKAKKLLRQKNCFYNSGIFITKVGFLLDQYKSFYWHYRDFEKSYSNKKKLSALYKKIESIPFDKAIMEKTKKAKLVKAGFYWQDFGSWQTIYTLLEKDKNKNVKQGNISTDASKNNFIFTSEPAKKVLVSGLKDVFFIDTPQYTLLADKKSIKKIKKILKKFSLG